MTRKCGEQILSFTLVNYHLNLFRSDMENP